MSDNSKNFQTGISTEELMSGIFKTASIEAFIDRNEAAMLPSSFCEYVKWLCLSKETVADRVIKRAGIERSFGHQLFRGTRKPSRDTAIQLAFGFALTVDETQDLLRMASKSLLYPRVKRDAVIIYSLHNSYSVIETQGILYEMGLSMLGGRYE